MTYFSVQSSFPLVIMTFGVMNGLGIGFGYAAPLSIIMKVSEDVIKLRSLTYISRNSVIFKLLK